MRHRLVFGVVAVLGVLASACDPAATPPTPAATQPGRSGSPPPPTATTPPPVTTPVPPPDTSPVPVPEHVTELGRLAQDALETIPGARAGDEMLAPDGGSLISFSLDGHGFQLWLSAGQNDASAGLGIPVTEFSDGVFSARVYQQDPGLVSVCDRPGLGLGMRLRSDTADPDRLIGVSAMLADALVRVTDSRG